MLWGIEYGTEVLISFWYRNILEFVDTGKVSDISGWYKILWKMIEREMKNMKWHFGKRFIILSTIFSSHFIAFSFGIAGSQELGIPSLGKKLGFRF